MKTIVITGGSDGIGKALAESLAKDHKVVILARNEESLKQIADQANCSYIVCDVRDAQQVAKTFKNIIAEHGVIDVLINNAGVIVNGDLVDTSYEVIENTISTNTLGAIFVAKTALQYMKERKSGFIVNVISQAGLAAKPNRSIYNASKWAMTGFTKALQQEAAEYGVRVTGFYPGTIQTDLFAKAGLEIRGPSLTTDQIVTAVEFLVSLDDNVLVPEFGIKPLS
jgi:short-subunit dehydrogenase